MKKPDFDALTQEQLARVHGVTTRAVQKWDQDGHPRNGDGSYSASESIQWRIDRQLHGGLNLEAERARLARAQSEKAELDLRVRRGTLLERTDVVRDGQALVSAMRARMRALPARLTPELSTPETYTAVRALIAGGVDEALLEISDEKFALGVAAHTLARRDSERGEASSPPDREPMGRPVPRAVERKRQRARKVANGSR